MPTMRGTIFESNQKEANPLEIVIEGKNEYAFSTWSLAPFVKPLAWLSLAVSHA